MTLSVNTDKATAATIVGVTKRRRTVTVVPTASVVYHYQNVSKNTIVVHQFKTRIWAKMEKKKPQTLRITTFRVQ